jgi:hypothetical protein
MLKEDMVPPNEQAGVRDEPSPAARVRGGARTRAAAAGFANHVTCSGYVPAGAPLGTGLLARVGYRPRARRAVAAPASAGARFGA